MSYLEIVKRALKERSVNQAAKDWGIAQPTLNRYATGKNLPDYLTAKIMAKEAGISAEEMLNALAAEETKMKAVKAKLSKSFNWLLRVANVSYKRVVATA
jgi:transcriptional regulator with XRE-family HTH domain